jgi:hypothetical protein
MRDHRSGSAPVGDHENDRTGEPTHGQQNLTIGAAARELGAHPRISRHRRLRKLFWGIHVHAAGLNIDTGENIDQLILGDPPRPERR